MARPIQGGLLTHHAVEATVNVWVWSARLAKSGKAHRELVHVPADSVPPGCGFASRHDAKAWRKMKHRAPRRE